MSAAVRAGRQAAGSSVAVPSDSCSSAVVVSSVAASLAFAVPLVTVVASDA